MLRIGMTGGIGSGKSTIAALFQRLGVPVCDTDQISRDLVIPGTEAFKAIRSVFGDDVLLANGSLNRSEIRRIVFSDAGKRKLLEEILHPRILQAVRKWAESHDSPYCIVVVPLLLEAGWQGEFDRILVIDASVDTQLARCMARDQLTESQASAIIASQLDRQKRIGKADDLIENNCDIESLSRQVERLHNYYLALSEQQG